MKKCLYLSILDYDEKNRVGFNAKTFITVVLWTLFEVLLLNVSNKGELMIYGPIHMGMITSAVIQMLMCRNLFKSNYFLKEKPVKINILVLTALIKVYIYLILGLIMVAMILNFIEPLGFKHLLNSVYIIFVISAIVFNFIFILSLMRNKYTKIILSLICGITPIMLASKTTLLGNIFNVTNTDYLGLTLLGIVMFIISYIIINYLYRRDIK
ncbi:MAG: hypothetical protein RR646_07005 [Erysipelotrichaceae bacterium]